MMDHDYAMFVGSNQEYLPYLNSFLNSLNKRCQEPNFEVKVIWNGKPNEEYFKAIEDNLEIAVEFIQVDEELMNTILPAECSKGERCKASRYYYLQSLGSKYKVCCLMDADLLVVSAEFQDFFNLINGTDLLYGCNEGFKWIMEPSIHTFEGQPVLPEKHKLRKFHCNVPLFLDVNKWSDVLDKYIEQIYRIKETRSDEVKRMGDLQTWNIAVAQCKKESKVKLTHSAVMTQVHYTSFKGETLLMKEGDYYYTKAGDPVFSLHGRPDRISFRNMENTEGAMQKHNVVPGHFKRWADLMEDEWIDCNFNQAVNLGDFVAVNPYWGAMGSKHKITALMGDGSSQNINPDAIVLTKEKPNYSDFAKLETHVIAKAIDDGTLEELAELHTAAKPLKPVEALGAKGIQLGFGNGALGKSDWSLMRTSIMDLGVKTFLEIGAGYSTVLIGAEVDELISLEFNQNWINMVNLSKFPNTKVYKVEYPEIELPFQPTVKYDMAFVDGPASSQTYEGRKYSMRLAAQHSNRVWCHDAGRPMETKAIKEVFIDNGWTLTRGSGGMQMWQATN